MVIVGEKVQKDNLNALIHEYVGNNCSIGLHEIGYNSPENSKTETAIKIMQEGLNNSRGGTTYFSVSYGVTDIGSYNYYGGIHDKVIVLVAIPECFKLSNGSIVYGGVFKKRYYKDDEGYPECLTDNLISSKIPPEFILGYFKYNSRDLKPKYQNKRHIVRDPMTGLSSYAMEKELIGYEPINVSLYLNNRFYNKLSVPEKDEFIKNLFRGRNFFDITDNDSIKNFYGLSRISSQIDPDDNYYEKTIKQYEKSDLYREKELSQMIDGVKKPRSFKVINDNGYPKR